MKIELYKFGLNITNEIIGKAIYEEIKKNIDSDVIEIDFKNIAVITTYCAKQIFGCIFQEIGSELFFKKFSFINADENIKYIISIGINNV